MTNSAEISMVLQAIKDVEFLPTAAGLYAKFTANRRRQGVAVRSSFFEAWLTEACFSTFGEVPRPASRFDALRIVEARVCRERAQQPLFTRVAEHEGRIIVDLGDDEGRVVEIDPTGFKVTEESPVLFQRSSGMQKLPVPRTGGSISELRKFLNPGIDDRSFLLIAAWLVAALRPKGPYPILLVHGSQGCGKSHLSRMLRALIDPSASPVRTASPSERDLLVAAQYSWLICFDNLSGLPRRFSDALCRLSTGGGISTRRLYTDSQEVILQAMRPVLANGIDDLTEREDLADRSLVLNLPTIVDSVRRTEEELWAEFDRASPSIFGALCTAISAALSRIGQVCLPEKPRMADFVAWATAAEEALGFTAGSFFEAYQSNRAETVELSLEYDLIAGAIRTLLSRRTSWAGTATQLISELEALVPERTRMTRAWPVGPRPFSVCLRRLTHSLRSIGIEVRFQRHARGQRVIHLNAFSLAQPAIPAHETQVHSDEFERRVCQ